MRHALLILLLLPLGCNSADQVQTPDDQSPLDFATWNQLPVARKYEPETLERLRSHDPNLEDDTEWDQFMISKVIPVRRQDIPSQY